MEFGNLRIAEHSAKCNTTNFALCFSCLSLRKNQKRYRFIHQVKREASKRGLAGLYFDYNHLFFVVYKLSIYFLKKKKHKRHSQALFFFSIRLENLPRPRSHYDSCCSSSKRFSSNILSISLVGGGGPQGCTIFFQNSTRVRPILSF